jgi:hypothetical protein
VDAYERWDSVQEQQQAQTIRAVPDRDGHAGHSGRGARRR